MLGETASLPGVARRSALGRVVAWVTSPHHRARLIDALKRDASLEFATSADELLYTLRSGVDPITVVVLPSADDRGVTTDRIVRQVARERPRTAIAVWCVTPFDRPPDFRTLAAAGAHQFLVAGVHDQGAVVRSILSKARQTNAAEQVMAVLRPVLPAALQPVAEAIVANSDAITSIRALADAMHIHRKTLFNRCEKESRLSPTELLTWCRLVLVAYHLDNTGCTIETIALDLSYPSTTALRNTIKRYTQKKASEARAEGAMTTVLTALAERLAG